MKRYSAFAASSIALAIAITLLCSCGGRSNQSMTSNNPSPPASSGGGSGSQGSGAPGASAPGSGSSGNGGSAGSGSGGSGSGGASAPAAVAFATQGLNQIFGVAVDSAGKVSTTAGSPYTIANAGQLWLAASGSLLFVDVRDFNSISANTIQSYRSDANGSLTKLATVPAKGASFIAVDASGKFLYASGEADASNQGFVSPTMYGFAIDSNSGNLTSLPGSPWTINHGETVGPLRVTPSGNYVCVIMGLAKTNDGLQCYPRHADGTIDAGTNYIMPAASNTGIEGFAFSPDAMHVLWTDGNRSQVHSAPLDSSATGIAIPSGGSFSFNIDVDPVGGPSWAVVDNMTSGNLMVIEVGAGGASLAGGQIIAAGTAPNQVRFSSSGKYVFVTTQNGTLVFAFDSTHGTMSPLNSGNPVAGNDALAAL